MANPLAKTLFPSEGNIIFEWICIGIVYTLLFWPGGNSVCIILLAFYWLFFQKKVFDLGSVRTRLMLLFCSLYLISIIGLAYTSNFSEGLFRLQQKSAILFLPMIFGTSLLPEKTFKLIKLHFIIATSLACVISIVYGLSQFLSTGVTGFMAKEQLTIFRDLNPPMTSLICLTAIIILLHEYFSTEKKRMILVISIVVFLSGYTILLGVRLLVFCLFLILLFFIFRYISSMVYRLTLAISFIVLTLMSLIFVPSLNRKWIELVDFSPQNKIRLDEDASLKRSWGGKAIRFAIWECSKDIIKRNWLFGVGTGDVQDSLQEAYAQRKFYFAAHYNKYNSHNQYLEMWLANGIPGLLIYILCLVVPLVIHFRESSALDYVLFLCLLIFLSFTESFLNINKGTIIYSFFNSIFGFAYLRPAIKSISTKNART